MNTKKIIFLILLAIVFISPFVVLAERPAGVDAGDVTRQKGIVPCGNSGEAACTIDDFFSMLGKIYSFIVIDIATPLAVLAVTIGGILILISAGNPNLLCLGKKIFWSAVIGLALALCSWAIINTILTMIGAKGL